MLISFFPSSSDDAYIFKTEASSPDLSCLLGRFAADQGVQVVVEELLRLVWPSDC